LSCLNSYDKDTYAIDILVNEGTAVYGTTQNEQVTSIVNSNTGWGNYVWTVSQQYVRGFHKTYYQVYAHLSQINVVLNDTIQPTTISVNLSNGAVILHPGGTRLFAEESVLPKRGFFAYYRSE